MRDGDVEVSTYKAHIIGCISLKVPASGMKKPTKTSEPSTGVRRTAPQGTRGHAVPSSSGPAQTSSVADVAAFVSRVKQLSPQEFGGQGRLIFAMDATMSRQPTWDMALAQQSEMFDAVKSIGGLDVQLMFFRGLNECHASKWVSDPKALARLMTSVSCRGGHTQICKVLSHARAETEKKKVSAVVYVGDCMEEDIDEVCARAGELSLLGVPVFIFQEGHDHGAEVAFREVARITKGAWCRFDHGAGAQLRELLSAVAVYATGGRRALEKLQSEARGDRARLLLQQLS